VSGVDVATDGGRRHRERSEATRGYVTQPLGCFVAPLLAMSKVSGPPFVQRRFFFLETENGASLSTGRGEARRIGPGAAGLGVLGERAKSLERGFFGLASAQLFEIPQNHQRILWKSLEKTSGDLEKLGKKACSIAARTSGAASPIRRAARSRTAPGECGRKRGEGNFPACKALKNHETRKEARQGQLMRWVSPGDGT